MVAGDCSAWIGLFDADEFEWPAGAPRPRYTTYSNPNPSPNPNTNPSPSPNPKAWRALLEETQLMLP